MTIIDMQTMRYINLLRTISKVGTNHCFSYNNLIIFVVPQSLLKKALGENGKNVRIIQEKLGKKIRIIREAKGVEDIPRFVQDIVNPVNFKSLELKDGVFIINAGSMGKAALIGRNKRRLLELNKIVLDCFGKELKIV